MLFLYFFGYLRFKLIIDFEETGVHGRKEKVWVLISLPTRTSDLHASHPCVLNTLFRGETWPASILWCARPFRRGGSYPPNHLDF